MHYYIYNFPFIYVIFRYYNILYANQQWNICIDKVLAYHTNIRISLSMQNKEQQCVSFQVFGYWWSDFALTIMLTRLQMETHKKLWVFYIYI